MRSQDELVRHLKEDIRVLTNPRLEMALQAVDRADFVPPELKDEAYEDYALPIGSGATISQPTTVAFMLEKLDVRPGQKVLDVGSGSGWTTALLAHLVGTSGKVIGLEIIPELAAMGQQNLAKYHSYIPRNVGISAHAQIQQTTRGVIGLAEEAPFDRILVSAAARKVPKELIAQLKPDGVLVIPVGAQNEIQKLVRIHKKSDLSACNAQAGNTLETEEYPGFVFVPLR